MTSRRDQGMLTAAATMVIAAVAAMPAASARADGLADLKARWPAN